MKPQSHKNHKKYYYPHHFIFYPVVLILIILSIRAYINYGHKLEFALLAFAFILVGWFSFITRQHYAIGNQNRIIRLEMRLRFYQLTNQQFELHEHKLSFGQIAALRFASNEEFPLLFQRTLEEDLTPNQIKKSIKSWQPDLMRI